MHDLHIRLMDLLVQNYGVGGVLIEIAAAIERVQEQGGVRMYPDDQEALDAVDVKNVVFQLRPDLLHGLTDEV